MLSVLATLRIHSARVKIFQYEVNAAFGEKVMGAGKGDRPRKSQIAEELRRLKYEFTFETNPIKKEALRKQIADLEVGGSLSASGECENSNGESENE